MGGIRHKSLVKVGDHEPLMYYILEGLKVAGVTDLLVVTGHARDELETYVQSSWNDSKVTFVFNARYASWGNFHSLRLALDQSPGREVLAINSDVVVCPDVYRRTAATRGDLVLAVERRRRLDAEDMRVEIRDSSVRSIGKNIPMGRSHGEFDGVSLLRPPAAQLYSRLSTDIEWSRKTTVYYEDVYQMMMSQIGVRAAFVEPGEYAEVDEPGDIAGAVRVIEAHAGAWPRPDRQEPSTVGPQ